MATAALAVFGICFAACFYIYFGYPALIYLIGRLRPNPVKKGSAQPSVSIIVAAHNEESVIADKIRNGLALEYPASLLEVIVGSNGSTDGTDQVVRDWGERDSRVKLVTVQKRGKAYALNAAVIESSGEILVFTDANTALDPTALAMLVESYSDPEVGAVTGRKTPQARSASDSTAEGEGIYWRYEQWQKGRESLIGSCYIGDGALHSVRRELYVPVADPAHGDDVAISTRVVLQGFRLIYEERAIVRECEKTEMSNEIRRKKRVTNRCMLALLGLGGALWTSGFYSVELLSHKVLRYMVPFFLIPMLSANVVLAPYHPFFAVTLVLQVLFYGLAAGGYLLRDTSWGRKRYFWIPYYFVFVNTAAFLGILELLKGNRPVSWTPRSGV